MRNVLFHRKYRRFHGGHLNVWHYFNHVLATPGFDARVLFDGNSSWDRSNPWVDAREWVIHSLDGFEPDLLFVAGRDWQRLEGLGLLDRGLPVFNLIQAMRHAEDWSVQSNYLQRKAIRICLSEEVAEAVKAAGAYGPTIVIPSGVDISISSSIDEDERPLDLFIAGLKQPEMAVKIAEHPILAGRSLKVVTEMMPRDEFQAAMRQARVTLFLPYEQEGFFLPALEGMALGTVVVCPDCVGNRVFCLDGVNAFRPNYTFDDLIQATEEALALPEAARQPLLAAARQTAHQYSIAAEREAFGRLLNTVDDLWAQY